MSLEKALIIVLCCLVCANHVMSGDDDATEKLFFEMIDIHNVKDADWVSPPDPYVRVRVADRKGKAPKHCAEGRWITRDDTRTPAWYATKLICRKYDKSDVDKLILTIDLSDQDEVWDERLALIKLPLKNLLFNMNKEQTITADHMTFRFRIRNAFPKATKKRIYLLRHTASKWNAMQSERDWWAQITTDHDHPLSPLGLEQALNLSQRIEAVATQKAHGTADERRFVTSDRVLSCPLARAVETAVIALDPLVRRGTLTKPFLLAQDVREKKNFGGKDSIGVASGKDLVTRIAKHMSKALFNGTIPLTMARTMKDMDLSQVMGQWWRENEDFPQLYARMQSFFVEQLMWDSSDEIIIVGHSRFNHEFVSREMHPHLKDKIEACYKNEKHQKPKQQKQCARYDGYTVRQFETEFMDYGSVLAVDLDFSGAIQLLEDPKANVTTALIRDLSFLFGTGMRDAEGIHTTGVARSAPQLHTSPHNEGSATSSASPSSATRSVAIFGSVMAVLAVASIAGVMLRLGQERRAARRSDEEAPEDVDVLTGDDVVMCAMPDVGVSRAYSPRSSEVYHNL